MTGTAVYQDWPYRGDTTKVVTMKKAAPLFVRFGHFQSETREPSMNWGTGEYERGISVYPAIIKADGLVSPAGDWIDEIETNWDKFFSDRVQYVVTGKVIAEGSDGEPVLMTSSVVIRGVYSPSIAHGFKIDLGLVPVWERSQ